jgi:hypothetical protein
MPLLGNPGDFRGDRGLAIIYMLVRFRNRGGNQTMGPSLQNNRRLHFWGLMGGLLSSAVRRRLLPPLLLAPEPAPPFSTSLVMGLQRRYR